MIFRSCIILLFSVSTLKAQINEQNFSGINSGTTNRYFAPSIGLINSVYRDFATSPLFYEGPGIHLGLGWTLETQRWENSFEANFNLSAALAGAPKSDYFQPENLSIFINNQLYNSYLRKVDAWSFGDYSIKLGATFMSDFNARINSGLQNAAGGIEGLANLMMAGKIETDISRTHTEVFKMWFFKRTLLPVRRKLSFQLNAGLLNFNWRPGYAYLVDSEFNGSDTNGLNYLLSAHTWSLNGWRVGTRFEYTKFRPNGNGIKISYLWDAVHAPGKFETFQMASHTFRYTLMINTNKH